jgi:hypothetical protein
MMRLAIAGLGLALVACANRGGDDPGPGPGGTGSGPGPGGIDGGMEPSGGSVSPRVGLWSYGEQTLVSTSCSATTPRGEAGDFDIEFVASTSFRIVPHDGTSAFSCTSSSAGFNCPDRATFAMDYRPGLDAMVAVHGTATGKFSDSGHGTGQQEATVTCSGTQCASIGPLPCMFRVNFAIHAEP